MVAKQATEVAILVGSDHRRVVRIACDLLGRQPVGRLRPHTGDIRNVSADAPVVSRPRQVGQVTVMRKRVEVGVRVRAVADRIEIDVP